MCKPAVQEASDTGSRRGSKGKSKGKEQRGWEDG